MAVAAEPDAPPIHILTAIAKVESGFHPWSFNIQGKPYFFDGELEAYAFLRRQILAGKKPDSGCMQINYEWHRHRFAKLGDWLDPYKNVRAGADFLIELKKQCGNWECAAGRYHNAADPRLNQIYRCKLAAELLPGEKFDYCRSVELEQASTKMGRKHRKGPRYEISAS